MRIPRGDETLRQVRLVQELEKLRVLVADDSVLSRKAVVEAVERTGTGKVEHTAPNGTIAIEWLQQCAMDVVLLGAYISGRNSLEILKEIKKQFPDVEVVILSDGDARCAEVTIEALAFGAFDFILKSVEADPAGAVEKIRNQLEVLFAQIKVKRYSMAGTVPARENGSLQPVNHAERQAGGLKGKPDLVLIASSTGGPAALETVLKQLPGDFSKPVLVVQHMPPDFTNIFAQTLDKKCKMRVTEAHNNDAVKPGQIVIAAGGRHMTVVRREGDERILFDDSPFVNGVRPSADVLFNSAAEAYKGRNLLVVVLTGMGNDGQRGVIELKSKCNCYCITQSEKTCVVYGMPRCVAEAGLSDETADIGAIAGRICQIVEG